MSHPARRAHHRSLADSNKQQTYIDHHHQSTSSFIVSASYYFSSSPFHLWKLEARGFDHETV
jgi:hypothetical protein